MKDSSFYTLPNETKVIRLDCDVAFKGLADREKLYAHYLSQASWYGGLITSIQVSPEAPVVFVLLHKIFLEESINNLKKTAVDSGVNEDEFKAFLVYSSAMYANGSNYKSFGDTKFIPNLPKNKFEQIIKKSKAYDRNPKNIQKLLDKVLEVIYCMDSKLLSLGLKPKGLTTYFSSNCTEEDANLVNEFTELKKIELWNSRCFKTVSDSGVCYEIRFASVQCDYDAKFMPQDEVYKNAKFTFKRGDYDIILRHVVDNLKKAAEYASNENECKMLKKYIDHFMSGSIQDHHDGSRFWIQNKGPIVETYIGFIENYRDPAGQRAEFEGFVSIVDKVSTEKFQKLVNDAEKFLKKMPWSQDFELDSFVTPEYTALDVLTFAGSSIPVGISLPNYEIITQNEGFKNVNLSNVIMASMKMDDVPFMSPEDVELLNRHIVVSYELTTALHELLGHGSGKLFKRVDGKFNFNKDKVINPLTGELVKSWYEENQSYNALFGAMRSAYEECRAEAISLYLSLEKDVLRIFEVPESEMDDVIYVGWLEMLWKACAKCLENYDPETKKWLQAHSQARYVIMRVCVEAGEGFLVVDEVEPKKNLHVTLDRSKLYTVGKKAIGDFLIKMQIYRATADVESAKLMFDRYSEVPEEGPHPWAKWRDIVLAHKKPRKLYVQPNTHLNESGKVELVNYDTSFEGLIKSWTDRFPSPAILDDLVVLAEKDAKHFKDDH